MTVLQNTFLAGVLLSLAVLVIAAFVGPAILELPQSEDSQESAPPLYSEAWCDALMEKPNPEWTEKDAKDFSLHCLD